MQISELKFILFKKILLFLKKNEIDLSLEQMRAMDSNIPIGVTYVPEVPMSVDTKEDLINIETNIREHNDKS